MISGVTSARHTLATGAWIVVEALAIKVELMVVSFVQNIPSSFTISPGAAQERLGDGPPRGRQGGRHAANMGSAGRPGNPAPETSGEGPRARSPGGKIRPT